MSFGRTKVERNFDQVLPKSFAKIIQSLYTKFEIGKEKTSKGLDAQKPN